MRASQKTPVRPTRLARLSPGAAMLIMLALLLLIAAGLGIITYGLYSFAMARYTKM